MNYSQVTNERRSVFSSWIRHFIFGFSHFLPFTLAPATTLSALPISSPSPLLSPPPFPLSFLFPFPPFDPLPLSPSSLFSFLSSPSLSLTLPSPLSPSTPTSPFPLLPQLWVWHPLSAAEGVPLRLSFLLLLRFLFLRRGCSTEGEERASGQASRRRLRLFASGGWRSSSSSSSALAEIAPAQPQMARRRRVRHLSGATATATTTTPATSSDVDQRRFSCVCREGGS